MGSIISVLLGLLIISNLDKETQKNEFRNPFAFGHFVKTVLECGMGLVMGLILSLPFVFIFCTYCSENRRNS